ELRQGTTGAAVTGWVRPSGELVALPWYVETLMEADGVLAIVAQTLEPEEQQLVLVELKTAQWQVLERGVSDVACDSRCTTLLYEKSWFDQHGGGWQYELGARAMPKSLDL